MTTFRAMNTDVSVFADEATSSAIERTFVEAEQRFSRFRDDSELACVNRATGPIVVSQVMFDALVAARRYVELTGGIFDPAIGGALVALGYDRSFAPGSLDRDADVAPPRAVSFLDVTLDTARREITRPHELQIDLGGMIKGRSVDDAAALLPRDGAIDAGGDAVLRGRGPSGWLIGIEDPRDAGRTIAKLRVRGRAVATSAANRRRWRVGRSVRHHLVDPRTRCSAMTDILQVTIVAATAELAEVLAKTVFVLGESAGLAFLERWTDVGAIIVPAIGTPIAYGAVDLVMP